MKKEKNMENYMTKFEVAQAYCWQAICAAGIVMWVIVIIFSLVSLFA